MPPEKNPAWVRGYFDFVAGLTGLFDQAGAISFLVSYNPGFVLVIEDIEWIPGITGTGAGATQTFQLRKGNAAGTSIATITVTLANNVLAGAGIKGAVSAANDSIARLADTDTFSITKDAAGTVFTASTGTFRVKYRTRNQARI